MRAGSSASIRSRRRRATTGDVPLVPIATTTSPRSTIAGEMKVECARSSITLTGRPSARARAEIAGPRSPAPAHEHGDGAMQVGGQRIVGENFDLRSGVGAERCEAIGGLRGLVGRVPAHVRAGGQQHAQLGQRELAVAHQDDGARLQIEKDRQEPHSALRFPAAGLTGIIFYICLAQAA